MTRPADHPYHTRSQRHAEALQALEAVDQAHVLDRYDALDDASKDALLREIEGVDWPEVGRLIESHVRQKPEFTMPTNLEPAPWYPHTPTPELESTYRKARQLGESRLRQGKVAAFCVAGGQGSRLGWDHPKGTFPATPIRKAPLFQVFAEYLRKAQHKYHSVIPLYVMTSPLNHDATVAFFEKHDHFGLDPDHVMCFPQAMMPAIDMQTHKVLMAAPDAMALSPNGHGGSLKALWTSGALADMKDRGVEQISYVQVDNPSVHVVDPLFIGLHAKDDAQMSSKMLPKREPMEKLGNFCVVEGKVRVIEYSNLPEELAHQRTDDGELRFRAGSIAIHVIRVDFVESLNNRPEGFSLPWNRAEKKVAFVDEAGNFIEPKAPNAVKLETFVFDALPLCENSIVVETDRVEEFAPIKNADTPEGQPPAADSPQSSKLLQSERAARWLESIGVSVPRTPAGDLDAVLEIAPLAAIEPEDLKPHDLPTSIDAGATWLLEG